MDVTIQPTEFTNVRSGEVTYGVRVYDDQGQAYDDIWDDIPDDDMDVLHRVLESEDHDIVEMLEFVAEHKKGIHIGEEWYKWNEIESVYKSLNFYS